MSASVPSHLNRQCSHALRCHDRPRMREQPCLRKKQGQISRNVYGQSKGANILHTHKHEQLLLTRHFGLLCLFQPKVWGSRTIWYPFSILFGPPIRVGSAAVTLHCGTDRSPLRCDTVATAIITIVGYDIPAGRSHSGHRPLQYVVDKWV